MVRIPRPAEERTLLSKRKSVTAEGQVGGKGVIRKEEGLPTTNSGAGNIAKEKGESLSTGALPRPKGGGGTEFTNRGGGGGGVQHQGTLGKGSPRVSFLEDSFLEGNSWEEKTFQPRGKGPDFSH